jgi:glycosyltransferase involved in cell wall biosynthesis
MEHSRRPRSLLITVGTSHARPWWWNHLDHESLTCEFDHQPILVSGGRPKGPLSWQFVSMCLQCVAVLFRARRARYRYIYTFECNWLSFIVAGVQTMLMLRRPRHVILQFIMREKTASLASRIKYRFMRWCFSSVHLCVCSSRPEAEYYVDAFEWPARKVAYVPLHTDPQLLAHGGAAEDGYVVSAGRTFRDYGTLLQSFSELSTPLVIVASPGSVPDARPSNVRVVYELPGRELVDLMSRSQMVVLPLEERQISIGQSVLLQAMALGKPVIVTRVNGTVDYVEHMKTGVLVPPRDPAAIRDAVRMLASDEGLRLTLGSAAREQMTREHLPAHYAAQVSAALGRNGRSHFS